jgi:hypothetical protein
MFDSLGKILAAMAIVGLGIFIACVMGAFAGYCAAWIANLVFHDAFVSVLQGLGVKVGMFTIPQFGALLGFVGGFMKTKVVMDTKTAIAYGKIAEEKKK